MQLDRSAHWQNVARIKKRKSGKKGRMQTHFLYLHLLLFTQHPAHTALHCKHNYSKVLKKNTFTECPIYQTNHIKKLQTKVLTWVPLFSCRRKPITVPRSVTVIVCAFYPLTTAVVVVCELLLTLTTRVTFLCQRCWHSMCALWTPVDPGSRVSNWRFLTDHQLLSTLCLDRDVECRAGRTWAKEHLVFISCQIWHWICILCTLLWGNSYTCCCCCCSVGGGNGCVDFVTAAQCESVLTLKGGMVGWVWW